MARFGSGSRGLAACLLTLAAGVAHLDAQRVAPSADVQQRVIEGERALAEGRYADAAQVYEAARRLSPGTAGIEARLGLIRFLQGQFAQAVTSLREAVRLKSDQPNVDVLLGMALSELRRYDEALPSVTRGFSQSADPVLRRMAGLHLQRVYTGLGRDLDAVEVAVGLTRLYPDDPEVLYHSGRLLANLAYQQTMHLAAVAPASTWLYLAAGEANESQSFYDAALREYRQVLAGAPRRPGVHFRIGRVLVQRAAKEGSADDLLEARQAFREELAVDPTNANAAYELGELHRQAGDHEIARSLFAQAVAADPAFEHALVGLGRILIAVGRPSEAIPPLKSAVTANPASAVAHYQLAQAYGAVGNVLEQERALAEFDRAQTQAARRHASVPEVRADVTPQTVELEPGR